jgi:hypothetical protein
MGVNSVVLSGLVGVMCQNFGDNPFDQNIINYERACTSAIEASTRQAGVYDRIRSWEKRQLKSTEKALKNYLGLKTLEISATSLLIANVLMGGRASIRLGKGPLDGNYYTQLGGGGDVFLGVGWDF